MASRSRKMAAALVLAALGLAIMAGVALAASPNYGTAWESYGGAIWNGKVQIQASYNDSGRHAKQGYQRFTRAAGPALDTGRMPTSRATSPSDSTKRSRQDWVWDSPLWGDKYTTHYYYGFYWF